MRIRRRGSRIELLERNKHRIWPAERSTSTAVMYHDDVERSGPRAALIVYKDDILYRRRADAQRPPAKKIEDTAGLVSTGAARCSFEPPLQVLIAMLRVWRCQRPAYIAIDDIEFENLRARFFFLFNSIGRESASVGPRVPAAALAACGEQGHWAQQRRMPTAPSSQREDENQNTNDL